MKLPRFTHALSLALGVSVTAPVLAIWKNPDDAVNIPGQPASPSPTRLSELEDIAINPASGKVYLDHALHAAENRDGRKRFYRVEEP